MTFKEKFLKAEGEAWKGNVKALEEIDDPNIVIHMCAHPIGMFPDVIGVEGHKQYILTGIKTSSNLKQEWSNFVEDSNTAWVRYKSRANLTGQMPGLPPPTGKEYTTDFLMLFKLKDGKITEGWMYGTISGMV